VQAQLVLNKHPVIIDDLRLFSKEMIKMLFGKESSNPHKNFITIHLATNQN
jgi:hypothetical protein